MIERRQASGLLGCARPMDNVLCDMILSSKPGKLFWGGHAAERSECTFPGLHRSAGSGFRWGSAAPTRHAAQMVCLRPCVARLFHLRGERGEEAIWQLLPFSRGLSSWVLASGLARRGAGAPFSPWHPAADLDGGIHWDGFGFGARQDTLTLAAPRSGRGQNFPPCLGGMESNHPGRYRSSLGPSGRGAASPCLAANGLRTTCACLGRAGRYRLPASNYARYSAWRA